MKSLFIFSILLFLSFHLFAQSKKDKCDKMFKEARDSSDKGNYSFAIDKLAAIKIVDETNSDAVDKEILRIYQEVDKKRTEAEEATRKATIAQQNERLQKGKAENLLGDVYLARARIALTRNDFQEASLYIDSSLQKKPSSDAAILFTKLLNSYPPFIIDKMDQAFDICMNPTNNEDIAIIGYKNENHSQYKLRLINYKTHECKSIDGHFMTATFSPDGLYLYVAAITKEEKISGEAMDTKYDREVGIIKFSLSLVPLDTFKIVSFPVVEDYNLRDKERTIDYDALDYKKILFTSDKSTMILSGIGSPSYMQAVSGGLPHHLKTVIDLNTRKISHIVGKEELNSFTSHTTICELIDDRYIISDGFSEIYSDDIKTGTHKLLAKHSSEVIDISVNMKNDKIAIVGEDNNLTLFKRLNNRWIDTIYALPGVDNCEHVLFVSDNEIAIARTDFSITLLSLKENDFFENSKLSLDFNKEWEAPTYQILTGHTGAINSLSISDDHKWLASTSEDNTTRVWSLKEYSQIQLTGNNRGVIKGIFRNNSKSILCLGKDGKTNLYNFLTDQDYSISNELAFGREYFLTDKKLDEGGGLTRAAIREHLDFLSDMYWQSDSVLITSGYGNNTATSWRWNKTLSKISDTVKESLVDDTLKSFNKKQRIWYERKGNSLISHSDSINKSKIAIGKFNKDYTLFIQLDYKLNRVFHWDLQNLQKPKAIYHLINENFAYADYGKPISLKCSKISKGDRYFVFPCQLERATCIEIIDLKSGESKVFNGDIPNLGSKIDQAFDVSDDGKIVVAGRTGKVYLFDIATDETKVIGEHSRYISSVIFSPNYSWVASGSRDRTIRLWNLNSEDDYLSFSFLNPVEKILFSPDGNQLLAIAGPTIYSRFLPNVSTTLNRISFLQNEHIKNYFLISYNACETKSLSQFNAIVELGAINETVIEKLNRKSAVEKILSKSVNLNQSNKNNLIQKIIAPSTSISEKTKALLELSAYGNSAADVAVKLFPVFKVNTSYSNEINPLLATELLPYLGAEVENKLIRSYAYISDKWEKIGTLQLLALSYPKSDQVNKLLKDEAENPDIDIRTFAAVSFSSAIEEQSINRTLIEAIKVGHDLREEAAEKLKSSHLTIVPDLINCLRSDVRSSYKTPVELARNLIIEKGNNTLSILEDSLTKNRGDYKFQADIINTISELSNREDALNIIIKLVNEDSLNEDIRYLISSSISYIRRTGKQASILAPYLIDVIVNNKNGFELDASWALAELDEKVIPQIIDAISKTNNRRYLYMALNKFGIKANLAIPYLTDDLKKCSNYDCSDIIETIGMIGDSSNLPQLFGKLKEVDGYIKADIVKAIGNINQLPDIAIPQLLLLMQSELSADYVEKYKTITGSIDNMKKEGVPKELLDVIKDLGDMGREKETFLNIISRNVDIDQLRKYESIILKYTKLSSPHECDSRGLFREAFAAIGKYGEKAKPYLRELNSFKEKVKNCYDINRDFQEAIKEISK